jgi:hypothetical protein
LAVVVAVLLKLVLEVRVVVQPVILALMVQRVLLGQTVERVEQTQAAVQAQEILLTQAQLVTEALELSSFVTLAVNEARAVP